MQNNGIDQPHNTALLLIASALDRDKPWVLTHTEYELTSQETQSLQALSARVLEGYPLPYVLGQWAFFGRQFKVTPAVLIPRPETESLVELALGHAGRLDHPRIMDVGTGSGAIAISLAAELSHARILASDVSRTALQVARSNAQRHAPGRVHFVQADLMAPICGPFDLVCANLPYIPRGKLAQLAVARWEPRLALDGGESGLEAIAALLSQSRTRLTRKGLILLEIESSLGQASFELAETHFPGARIRLIQDLAGLDRIVEIQRG